MANKPVIKIPSRNIYGKYNQKVLENYIDRIETKVNVPSLEMGNEAVLNDKIFDGFYVGEMQQDLQDHTSLNFAIKKVDVVSAWVKLTPTYVTKTISIPKQGHNLQVLEILTGYNQYGSANISYTIFGKTITGTATAVADLASSENKYVKDLQIQETGTSLGRYFIRDSDINVSKYYRQATSSLGEHDVTATVNLDNKENILTATATEYADHFEITLTILSGIEKITLGGWALWANDEPKASQVVNMSGEYLKYIPTQIDFTINGKIIKLVLTEKELVVGNGNYSYGLPTNELIQSTNTYATQAQQARFMAQSATPQVKTNQLVAQYTIDLTDKQADTQQTQSNPFPMSFTDYKNSQQVMEENAGFQYKRFCEPVHTESIDLTDKYIGETTENYKLLESENETSVVGIQFVPTYVNKTISIPIIRADEELVELDLGVPEPEDKEVVVRLYGTVNKGKATNALICKENEVSFNWEDTEYEQQETNEEDYKLQTTQEYSIENGASIKLKLDNKDNLGTQTVIQRVDDNALIDFTILCGLKITKLGTTFNSTSDTATMDGIYEEFIPTSCEITIYGNTIELEF